MRIKKFNEMSGDWKLLEIEGKLRKSLRNKLQLLGKKLEDLVNKMVVSL